MRSTWLEEPAMCHERNGAAETPLGLTEVPGHHGVGRGFGFICLKYVYPFVSFLSENVCSRVSVN